ncbi:hypothetical protein, partial [Nocardia farcinica]|uniref:hypothetical protein n=1 Tax=Nocardia farcinica TaxID=37329 RepID=UPI001E622C9A
VQQRVSFVVGGRDENRPVAPLRCAVSGSASSRWRMNFLHRRRWIRACGEEVSSVVNIEGLG